MSNRARELLELALEALDFDRGIDADDLMEEIRACLAEPEVKRERLSDAFIYQVGNRRVIAEFNDEFHAGVRFAEKHHGIGGEG